MNKNEYTKCTRETALRRARRAGEKMPYVIHHHRGQHEVRRYSEQHNAWYQGTMMSYNRAMESLRESLNDVARVYGWDG